LVTIKFPANFENRFAILFRRLCLFEKQLFSLNTT
jgi:hypothetical protein